MQVSYFCQRENKPTGWSDLHISPFNCNARRRRGLLHSSPWLSLHLALSSEYIFFHLKSWQLYKCPFLFLHVGFFMIIGPLPVFQNIIHRHVSLKTWWGWLGLGGMVGGKSRQLYLNNNKIILKNLANTTLLNKYYIVNLPALCGGWS